MLHIVNVFLMIVLSLLVGALLYFRLTSRKVERPATGEDQLYTIDGLTNVVKHVFHDITSSNLTDLGLSEEEFRRRKNKRAELKRALRGCTSGDIHDKTYVKQFMFDLLRDTYMLDETKLHQLIPFDDPYELSAQDQFEILLYQFKKRYRMDALSVLIETYKLDRPKMQIEDGQTESYVIAAEEIHELYKKEARRLSYEDKLQIIVQRVYQQYKGFSVIDEIRDMNIDGVSGGVSGLPPSLWGGEWEVHADQMMRKIPKSHDSVWIFHKGKSIHLSFLSFGSEEELKRVCQNIYKYNHPGQLSEANGFMVNEMKDGSRVVVLRPRFSESWAFFVRKFDIPKATLEQLIQDDNSQLPIHLIQFLVKGCRITAITGAQGSGKTTLLMAMVKHIYGTFTLRVQEMTFELHLRKIYRERNILSLRETDNISGQEGLDIQKKTDGTVNILGEVATDPVAAWMIQMAQVASLFTLFTHHAKTFRDLVYSLRNSLLKVGVFTNEKAAEQQVVSVLNFDIHLKKDYNGHRYIERITECVPLDREMPYPDAYKQAESLERKMELFMDTAAEFFRRSTDRVLYKARNIVEFREGKYVAVHPISKTNRNEMIEQMSDPDREAFKVFFTANWGDRHGQ